MNEHPGDQSARSLTQYDRPNVTVDAVILTVVDGELSVVTRVGDDTPHPRLPGGFVRPGETLRVALDRVLGEKTGLSLPSLEQLHTFDDLQRDPRGWVMSVAHYGVVNPHALVSARGIRLMPIPQLTMSTEPPTLGLDFDHDQMVWMAVNTLREKYQQVPDPWQVLDYFTLADLRELHAAIDPDTLPRDSFRRLMEPQLVDTGEYQVGSIGRPSRVWRHPTADERLMLKMQASTPKSREELRRERSAAKRPSAEMRAFVSSMTAGGMSEEDAVAAYERFRESKRGVPRESVSTERFTIPQVSSAMSFATESLDSYEPMPVADASARMRESPSSTRFEVLVRWKSGHDVHHTDLRRHEASKIYQTLLRELAFGDYSDASDFPVSIEMRDDDGDIVQSEQLKQ